MSEIEKLPPHSIEAEEAVLGSLLIDPDAIFEVASFLKPDSFYRVKNKWIYEAIRSLNERREPLDLITVTEELRRREQLEDVGGEAYVISLINAVPTSINAQSYARVVEATAVRRQMIKAAGEIANLAFNEAEDINVVIDRAERALFGISEERTTRDLVPVKQIASEYLERIQELNARGDDVIGVPTGFPDLDRLLGGLNKSDLIIIAARPGMGKCLTADSRLVDPQTGALETIETLVKRRAARVFTLNPDFQLEEAAASDFVDDGLKPAFRVVTALGREVKTTLSHPFLTMDGWQPLHALSIGDRIAVPRTLPVFGQNDAPAHKVKVLAYMLADGSLTGSSPDFTYSDPVLRSDFAQAALEFPGNKVRISDFNGKRTPTVSVTQDSNYVGKGRDEFAQRLKLCMFHKEISTVALSEAVQVAYGTVTQWRSGRNFPSPNNFRKLCNVLGVSEEELVPLGHAQASQISNTLTAWLEQMGVWGKSALEKAIPAAVYSYTKKRLALFLNRLFACDGSAYLQNGKQPVISYTSSSQELAKGVQHLLLRFGVIARLRQRQIKYREQTRTTYQVRITHGDSLLTFVNEIGILGKETAIALIRQRCESTRRNANHDTIPRSVWVDIKREKNGRSWASVQRQMGLSSSHNLHVGQRDVGRQRLHDIATVLEAPRLAALASSDVYWDQIVQIETLGPQQVYDLTVPGTHNFVAEDILVHNTSLQNAIALTAARRYGKRIALFNLEMSGEQLVQRMVAAETRIDSQRLRRGDLQDHEWPIFMESIGRLSETRIFIDDTPSITPNQLRTKSRRLYAEHGLDLIMIDYLQLMQAERTTSNRVQEISEISRALKGLARELDVPVVSAAQLSRAVEQRQDKRPLLSDLRDSGCLAGETLVTLADTGQRVLMRDLVGQSGFKVWALNGATGKLEEAAVSNAFSTGVKPVYRLTTRKGRTVRATGNHKFRALAGWIRLDELEHGDFIAIPDLPTDESKDTAVDLGGSEPTLDMVISIDPDGSEEVFDLTVPGPHNFVANDIIVHNSIEQDADVVMFIYRDEYYNPDTTERPNIAEIAIAKHRNGPTGVIDLYWHGKLATFRNLQRQEISL